MLLPALWNPRLYQKFGAGSGLVAHFVGSNLEWLEGTPVWNGSTTTSFTVAGWFDGAPNGQSFLGNGVHFGKRIYVSSQNGVGGRFRVDQAGGGDPSVAGNFPIGLVGWHFVVWGHDSSTGKLFLSINGESKIISAGINTGQDLATGGFIWIGRDSTNIPQYYTGNAGLIGAWNIALDNATITSLFNAGVGKFYTDLTVAEKVGLVSFWNLDEAAGNRLDSHGTNNLIDNNTVGSVPGVPAI